jgi:hypothetical protein
LIKGKGEETEVEYETGMIQVSQVE